MTVTSTLRQTRIALVVIFVAATLVLGNQNIAEAEGLGSQIVCSVFSDLNQVGSPLPSLDAEGCPDDSDPVPSDPVLPPPPPPPVLPSACMDGIDNDGDGLIDWALVDVNGGDPGCTSPLDTDETNDPVTPPPPVASCADGIDNDSDGLVDHPADPGCEDAADDDETDSPTPPDDEEENGGGTPGDSGGGTPTVTVDSGSSGGGGGGGGGILNLGQVLGTTTASVVVAPQVCDPYLKSFIKLGAKNNIDDVQRLQMFFNQFEGTSIEVTGTYDQPTVAAVRAFQSKHLAEILAPWGIGAPTGYVYLTTRKKVNEIHCNSTFPLSSEEEAVVAKGRGQVLGAATPTYVSPAKTEVPATTIEVPAVTTETAPPEAGASIVERVKSYFGRIFGRTR